MKAFLDATAPSTRKDADVRFPHSNSHRAKPNMGSQAAEAAHTMQFGRTHGGPKQPSREHAQGRGAFAAKEALWRWEGGASLSIL